MNGITLDAPYLDTDADQLSFALDHPLLGALAVRELTVGGFEVQLRLLGASHQVCAGPVRETVACLPGARGGLPDTAVRDFDGWRHSFGARVDEHPGCGFGTAVARIRDLADAHPGALYGVFPGSADALTALIVERNGAGLLWRTWHTYPRSRRIVATRTRLEAR
ncbi:DUF2617 family protein [Streptomyces somaliensis]|uniref:DUF2617 family protein n=1 Tax=Streptomyces somaliensis TaxID=78355 RepID=UPI0020CF94FE|nr:DUF2617 family protein [Streptomyces somaliensis]MCP9946954.1 DUF2617 family protein [Streptomyces somaliensis]MCP9972819.1 DUF2617 family protein [Streptomyces somaliensis]MCP9976078.1 DUF2617 family protein [Streptomyces somaliensis]